MALLLDAYMQWFHIGSYRLAARFSQQGGLVHFTGKAYIRWWSRFLRMLHVPGCCPRPWKKCLWQSLWGLLWAKSGRWLNRAIGPHQTLRSRWTSRSACRLAVIRSTTFQLSATGLILSFMSWMTVQQKRVTWH